MTNVYITGHSLGAARAALYAYSRVVSGLPVSGLFLFGCPNPGNRMIGKLLSSIPVYSYKNRRDLVTNVPIDLEFLNEEYLPVTRFYELNEPAPATDAWGIFSDHHSELYQAGIQKMFQQPKLTVTPLDAINAVVDLYNNKGVWSWTHFVDAEYCAAKEFPDSKLMVFRGSTTALDWIDDFDAFQTTVLGARMSNGFWNGICKILTDLDNAVK